MSILVASNTNEAEHLGPEANGGSGDGVLVRINDGSLPGKIDLVGLDHARSLDNLPANKEEDSNDLHGVVGEEALDSWGSEGSVAVEDDDEGLEEKGDVSAPGLESSVVGHLGTVNTLSLAGAVVADEGDGHDEVVDDTTGSDDVDQPGEDLARAVAALEESKEGEQHNNAEAVDGHTLVGALAEEARGTTLEGQGVERSSGGVGVGVTGREDGGEHEEVDNVRQNIDAEVLHRNDIRRGTSTGLSTFAKVDLLEGGVVGGEDDANSQRSENEEETESVVNGLEGGLDVDARSLGFGRDETDVLGSDNCETRAPQSGKEAFEATFTPFAPVGEEGLGLCKMTESISIPLGVATAHGDEGEAEQNQDEENLSTGEPKFGFTIVADSEDVEKTIINETG